MHKKDGMADNQKQKNVKVIPVKSEQYLRDQLSKHRKIDTLEDIIRQYEN